VRPIAYKSEEKIVKGSPFWKALQAEGVADGYLDVARLSSHLNTPLPSRSPASVGVGRSRRQAPRGEVIFFDSIGVITK